MQKCKILFLLLLVLSCKHKKIDKIWEVPNPANTEGSFFSYGAKAGSDIEGNLEKPPLWGPSLKVVNTKICLYSQDDFFRSKEYGPSLGVCVEDIVENHTLLTSALVTLNELDETKIRPDGYLKQDDAQAHLYFLSLTEIVNEISIAKSRSFLLGDNRLHTALEKRMDLSFETHKSIAGKGENHIETSFSLPYFSIYTIDGVVKLVLPPLDSAIPKSQFHYLVLEVTNLTEFVSLFQSNFSSIQSINETWKTNCSREKLVVTEVMGYASGSTKRFIEWSGSKDNPNCIEPITIDIAGKKTLIETNSQFLFPGAVKLFVEDSSPLQGIVLKDANWKEIKSASTLQLNSFNNADTWKLPDNVNFNWADAEFSLKRIPSSCEWTSAIIQSSKLCGDPGLALDDLGFANHTPISPTDGNGTPSGNTIVVTDNTANNNSVDSTGSTTSAGTTPVTDICKPESMILTELNAYGLMLESKLDKSGKFIELKYIGVNECKLTDLSVSAGATSIPLYGSTLILKPNSYWVISDGKHFTGLTNLIRRNLDFLQWQDSISVQNPTTSKNLFSGLQTEDVFLTQKMDGTITSMVFNSQNFTHHTNQRSIYLQAAYRNIHAMSPGEANTNSVSDAYGELSEVLWAGAYKNASSIPDEKFIELKTRGEGTLKMEVLVGNKLTRFYVPVSKTDAFTVISKGEFQCFPNSHSIKSDFLALSDSITDIKLKINDEIISQLLYDPSRGNGLSNSTLKLKASFVNSGVKGSWRTSISSTHTSISPDCLGQVYASPDNLNEFEPFLVDESFDYNATGKFYLGTSFYDQNLPFSVKLYSYLPQGEALIPVEKIGADNLIKPIVNPLNTNSLIYQRLADTSDLKIYNQDGIYIEGVMTNPYISQNEWILLCNRGKITRDLVEYEIQDQDSTDRIETYLKRKNTFLPTGLSNQYFNGMTSLLSTGQCAYLVDPDAYSMNLKPKGITPTLVVTIKTTSTIGNGISSGESLDLFKYVGNQRIHVHSFGNLFSHSPFFIPVSNDEIILLLSGKKGESKYDYEVVKW